MNDLRPAVAGIPTAPVPSCPACGSEKRRALYEVREHEYTTTTVDAFPLVECLGCTARYLSPRPHESALGVIYPPNYYAYAIEAPAAPEGGGRGLFARLSAELFRRRIRPVERHLPLSPKTRWLEVGCGSGTVLRALRDAYGVRAAGVDYSEEAAARCRRLGFEAYASRFEDFEPPSGTLFDVVHSSHLIEHVASPRDYMAKTFALLRPGGLSAFITPNVDTWEARLLGPRWGGLHVPRHWTLLNPRSAEALGRAAGFEHVETRFSTNGAFWQWSFHALTAPRSRSLADLLFPSDHRFVSSGMLNILRLGAFSGLDALNLLLQGRSSNMLAVFRKPG